MQMGIVAYEQDQVHHAALLYGILKAVNPTVERTRYAEYGVLACLMFRCGNCQKLKKRLR